MKLTSQTFNDNQVIKDKKYTGYGEDIFPQLTWSEFPEDTKSFALFVHDKDAPIASGFWHLQVVDIPVDVTSCPEGVYNIKGFQRNNDYDKVGYIGPKPPKGTGKHEYRFTVYALPFVNMTEFMNSLGLPHTSDSSRALAAFVVERNKLDSASIAYWYEVE